MSENLPPTIDPVAAARWQAQAPAASPWLHEEVARRMQDRLQWMAKPPQSWLDWEPVRGGLQAHALVAQRYPQAQSWVHEPQAQRAEAAHKALGKAWWSRERWAGKQPRFGLPAAGQEVDMLWANMQLHMAADPLALLAQWHKALAVDGFVMFSCLGPDTAHELRDAYQQAGWPAAGSMRWRRWPCLKTMRACFVRCWRRSCGCWICTTARGIGWRWTKCRNGSRRGGRSRHAFAVSITRPNSVCRDCRGVASAVDLAPA